MFTEIDPSLDLVELSDAELDTVAGGFDIAFSASTFEHSESETVSFNRAGRPRHQSRSSHRRSSSFQFVGTGFKSESEALSVLSGVSQLLGHQ